MNNTLNKLLAMSLLTVVGWMNVSFVTHADLPPSSSAQYTGKSKVFSSFNNTINAMKGRFAGLKAEILQKNPGRLASMNPDVLKTIGLEEYLMKNNPMNHTSTRLPVQWRQSRTKVDDMTENQMKLELNDGFIYTLSMDTGIIKEIDYAPLANSSYTKKIPKSMQYIDKNSVEGARFVIIDGERYIINPEKKKIHAVFNKNEKMYPNPYRNTDFPGSEELRDKLKRIDFQERNNNVYIVDSEKKKVIKGYRKNGGPIPVSDLPPFQEEMLTEQNEGV